jgi:hypothetical protein
MLKKGNSFYSDWFTADGKRHRKAHPSQLAAQRHQNLMRRTNTNPQPDARSAKPSRPSSRRPISLAANREKQSGKLSSRQRPTSHSPTSERPTSNGRARHTRI